MRASDEQPLILSLHDVESPKIRRLREEEFGLVAGGGCVPPKPVPTLTVTPDGDGGDDGCDDDAKEGATIGSATIGSP